MAEDWDGERKREARSRLRKKAEARSARAARAEADYAAKKAAERAAKTATKEAAAKALQEARAAAREEALSLYRSAGNTLDESRAFDPLRDVYEWESGLGRGSYLGQRKGAIAQAEQELRDIAPRAGLKPMGRGMYSGYRELRQGVPTQALRSAARFGAGALGAAAMDLMGREEHTPQEFYREQGRGIAEMTGLNPGYGEGFATTPREVAAILMALEAAKREGVPYEQRFPEGIRVGPGEPAITPQQVENVRAMQRQRR